MLREDDLLEYMVVVDEEARGAIVYYGEENVRNGFLSYAAEYYRNVDAPLGSRSDHYISIWEENNDFLILVDIVTRELYGIRDFGRYSMGASDYFLCSDLLPVFMHPGDGKFEMSKVDRMLGLYYDMLKDIEYAADKSGKSPLVITESMFDNEYLAWDIRNSRTIIVNNYKEYNDKYVLRDHLSEEEIDHDGYFIWAPSDDIITGVDLFLDPFEWKHKLEDDEWEKRDTIKADAYILSCIKNKNIRGIYLRGVDLINKGRMMDLGCDDEFARLEKGIENFERYVSLGEEDEYIKESGYIRKEIIDIEKRVPILRITVKLGK